MRPLYCACTQPVFHDNTDCGNCGRTLGFDPMTLQMHSANSTPEGLLRDDEGNLFQLCANRRQYSVCNGLVPLGTTPDADALCNTCLLNRTIPVVTRKKNLNRWQRLESAKRRCVAGLTAIGLEAGAGNGNQAGPMRFDFIEDKRSHPDVLEQFVSTGHKDGLITINLMEADEIQRVQQRELSGERYRTLLGHFRHEAGHYFYPQLVTDHTRFVTLFGDPTLNYETALRIYYDNGPPPDWGQLFISAYASSHPLEDWAECFAHFLHLRDTLETAVAYGLITEDIDNASVSQQLHLWGDFIVSLNETNRSLGLRDPYPFVINGAVADKLTFVQQTIDALAASRL
ncbi:MAG: putative zinc-binding metallopeptidase [Halioglobus sp.]